MEIKWMERKIDKDITGAVNLWSVLKGESNDFNKKKPKSFDTIFEGNEK